MIKVYEYQGREYDSRWKVRQALCQNGVLFGEDPLEDCTQFWNSLGVVYKELPDPEKTPEEVAKYNISISKKVRDAKVASLSVDVDGMVFDGDETAQTRMLNAVRGLELSGDRVVNWVLADNTVRSVTIEQLKRAFSKANKQTRDCWATPYTNN